MPKVTAASIVLTALIAATLTGCAAASETAPSAPDAVDESAAPLVAVTPEETPTDDAESAFVASVRTGLPQDTQIPDATDQQLIDAGYRACDALESGDDPISISVIDGEQQDEGGYFQDSIAIITASVQTICPELAF